MAAPFGQAPVASTDLGLECCGVKPCEAGRSAIGNQDFPIVGYCTGSTGKSRQGRDVALGVGIDYLDRALRGVGDEDTAALRIEDTVIEGAAGRARDFDHACSFQRHDDLMPLSACCLCLMVPSMCNPLGNAERCTGLGR